MSLRLNRPAFVAYQSPTSAATNLQAQKAVPRHQLLVKFAFFLFLALLVEGIVRKWLFPSKHEYFYFFRDPFLLCFYAIAIGRTAIQLKGWFALWIGVAFFSSLISLLVYTLNEMSAALWILG